MSVETDIKRLAEGLKMTDDNGNPLAGARWSPDEERRLRDAEKQYGKHGDSLRPFVTTAAPVKPTGGTILEALENLQTHAARIYADAWELENSLTGTAVDPGAPNGVEPVGGPGPAAAGIWDRLAAKIVMIERVFAQIDESHAHAQASLK